MKRNRQRGVAMRMKLEVLVVAFAVSLLSATSAMANNDSAPQLNDEAALVIQLPTADPCIINDIRVDVLNFVIPGKPSFLNGAGVTNFNVCTGEILHAIYPVDAMPLLTEAQFVTSWDAADLRVTVPALDVVTQLATPLTLDLHWKSAQIPTDGSSAVTGEVRVEGYVGRFDSAIQWNRWGSDSFPWAGYWHCRFTPQYVPGCKGQI